MRFNHIGYVVSDSDATAVAVKPFFPVIVRYKEYIAAQKVFITLLATADGDSQIELVEPLENNLPLRELLVKSGKSSLPYHICFEVNNFDEQFKIMKTAGWIVLTRPFNAFNSSHRASHLYHPDAGVIEIMTGPL
ncbi:VOC family protein [Pseudomonas sp. 6D_7.1_Bac1]|uniref:VOC family protein n=1 Tax=Pseudomonas sp. 6D_7.1_Bac1 TaxID=2971615 RepID=UPI0021C66927|nr:VOC family protein [Pseudomonas sp. 6D_7.1_Bac1]MCU1748575.1 VOC family protein [Pseudomonas sp. 6D_7.1_Bac1]